MIDLKGNIINMIESLKQRCELFVVNREIMKNNFKWDNSMLYPLCASLYAANGLEVDAIKIKKCKEIIKKKTGMFSYFRGTTFLALATMLSLEENPEDKFEKIFDVYNLLKKKFHTTTFLTVAAFVVVKMVEPCEYDRVITKAKDIYIKMKKEHPILTSSEDCGFAVMFAVSDLSVHRAINEIEKCYSLLSGKFFSSNAVQALSHTLALAEDSAEVKCNKTMDIYNLLKEKKCKYGTGMELATLGVIALATDNVEQVVNDIVEVNEYLQSNKGFGALGTGKSLRIMYAGILVANEYSNKFIIQTMNTTVINSLTSILIAQQVAIAAAVGASAAAASSGS
jgi:hypothetical protein